MSKFVWSALNRQQVGAFAEYFVKMELTMHGFEVYSTEVDDRGIDFIARLNGSAFIEIQVKSLRKNGYVFMEKDKFKLKDHAYLALVLLNEGKEPELFLIPSEAWKTTDGVFVDRPYVGKKSKPEWGVNVSQKNMSRLFEYVFDKAVMEMQVFRPTPSREPAKSPVQIDRALPQSEFDAHIHHTKAYVSPKSSPATKDDPIRERLVAVALEWQNLYGIAPAITSTVSEFDAAKLVGMPVVEYSKFMSSRTAVAGGLDFVWEGIEYQVKANRPSGGPGSRVTLVPKAKNYNWDKLIWILYNKQYEIQEAWMWDREAYRKAFDSVTRLSPNDYRQGHRLV